MTISRLFGSGLFLISPFVFAGPSTNLNVEKQIDAQQQKQQAEQDAAILAQQTQSANVRLEGEKEASLGFPQNEAQCFPINQLVLTDYQAEEENSSASSLKLIQPSQFSWALKSVYAERDFALPACIGSEGINVLLRRIQNRLIDFGYVTTRVVVEPQDLRSGMLVLTVIPGKVGRIQLQDQSAIPFATRGTLWFAMPMAQGDILNIRNIEQGLENLKRVPSADANMELVPTDAVGETDVVIAYKQSLPFHLTFGLDDSGSKSTGRLQGSATFSWDNVLTLNDMFYISGTRSFKRDSDDAEGDYGSKNISLYYSIPWKNYLLTLSGSKYSYHQTVAGAFESYTYSGESQQMKANLSRLLSRGSLHKTYVNAALWTKNPITISMTPKLKCNVVVPLVGKWGLITPNTLVKLFYNCLRTINVVRVGINPYLLRKKRLVKGLPECRFLLQALILPILSLSATSLSALTPAGMDNGTAHL